MSQRDRRAHQRACPVSFTEKDFSGLVQWPRKKERSLRMQGKIIFLDVNRDGLWKSFEYLKLI